MKKPNDSSRSTPATSANATVASIPEETVQLLLRRIVELYEQNLASSDTAKELLRRWGITNYSILGIHHIGYSTGKLPQILNDAESKGQLTQLQSLASQACERSSSNQ